MNDDPSRSDFDSPEEAIFELTQDVLSAKRQIESLQKILSETEAGEAGYREMLEIDLDRNEQKRWQEALERSLNLQDMCKARIAKLENALIVLEQGIRSLKT